MSENVIYIDTWLSGKYFEHKEKCIGLLNLANFATDTKNMGLSKALAQEAKQQKEKAQFYKKLRDDRRASYSKYEEIYSVTFVIPAWA